MRLRAGGDLPADPAAIIQPSRGRDAPLCLSNQP